MESNRNNPIFRLKKSKIVELSLRYVAVTKFGLLGSFLCPLTKSECFYSILSSEGNETLGSHSDCSLTCYSSMQRPESRSSGGCSAGDGREIEIMNQNTTQGRSGKTDERHVYLEGGPPSTGCYESGNVPTSHNLSSTSVESQSGNTSLNFISTPPSVKKPRLNTTFLEDCRVGPEKFQCPSCPQLKNTKRNMKNHILGSHPAKAREMGLSAPDDLYCKICGNFSTDKSNLQKHMRYHKTETNVPILKRQRDNLDMFDDWRDGPNANTFQCKFCLNEISTRRILKTHILKWHRADGEKLGLTHSDDLVCTNCGTFCRSKTQLKKHMEIYHEAVSSMQRPESRSSGGCFAGDGREIEMMNQNTTQGRSGKTDESYVYLEGGPPSTGCYESGNVPTTHNFPSTSVESQSGNRPEFSFDPFVISDPCCGEHWDFIDV